MRRPHTGVGLAGQYRRRIHSITQQQLQLLRRRGVHAVFADGSGQLVSYNIQNAIFQFLRNDDGRVIEPQAY